MTKKLTAREIESYLKTLKGWNLVGKSITKKYKFKNFVKAVEFVNEITKEAERVFHHPDITIKNYNEVVVSITTHDAGGLTRKDFSLAKIIDRIIK